MLRVRTNDGASFIGPDAKAIVRQMKKENWHTGPQPKREYMKEVQARIEDITGERIPLDAEGFLLALQRLRFLEIHGGGSVA